VTVLNRAWLVATGLAAVVAGPAIHAVAQSPGVPPSSPQAGLPNTSAPAPVTPDVARAEALLRESRQALDAKNMDQAIGKFREAAVASGNAAEMRERLMEAGRALVAAGVHPDQLRPPVNVADRKNESLRLVAQGRVALERGDAAAAVQLARQAESLMVPESAFAAGEMRPWQLLLDAEAAARRAQGAVQTAAATGNGIMIPGMVAQAGGTTTGSPTGNVVPVQATSGFAGSGSQLFSEGLEALAAGNRELARTKFSEAWKYEAELPPEVRQQLKDKLTLLQPTGGAPAGNLQPLSPLDAVDQQQQMERQRVYREISNELSEAERLSTAQPLEALERIKQLTRRVAESSTDEKFKQQMLSIVQRAQNEQQKYVDANRASIDLQLKNEQVQSDIDNARKQREATNEQIAELVNTFQQYMSERRYPEAEVIAKKVQVLAPDSEIAAQLMTRSRVALRRMMGEEIAAAKEETVIDYLLDVERAAAFPDPSLPLHMPEARVWEAMSETRLGRNEERSGLSPSEERIRRRLMENVDVRFPNRPLGEVLQTLGTVSGVPIVIDQQAIAEARVNLEEPINLDLSQPVMLKSALQLILNRYDLTWIIQDEVLQITNQTRKRGNVYPVTYKVADLVLPIPNFVAGSNDGLTNALRAAYQMTQQTTEVRIAPVSTMDLASSKMGNPNAELDPNTFAQYGNNAFTGPSNGMAPGRGGGAFADFEPLMELIRTTIVPDTWEDLGGPSTMAEYRGTLSLVISTTTDVHERIADLLASLRRLQNLQVTIEVRFITLSDSFYERIGVDFDVAFDDNTNGNLPMDDRGPSVTVGLSGENRLLTSDLDVQFNQGSFGPTAPGFGGYTAGQGGQIGFAILSDIEAFFFLEAAQGDSRSNVLQAPKVTMFDGQTANIIDTTSRPFVTSIIPVVGDFAVAQQPVIVVLAEGTQLNVQAVVSDDRRFVRLTLVPMFTQITDVDTFTYEGSRRRNVSSETIDPDTGEVIESDEDEEIVSGSTVQQPSFAQTSISTTVSVPDGGTILLGGIKRLRENRSEVGVPMLSKIPYVNRLFRNVGIGREATSLMMMVTPRIIIQEEEEIAQTGFDPNR
jgi:general secretion pathway protein D